ncbi:MAG: TauD/TfdA dioxygenase family protein [Alphaproteobacteria bacterium]
MAVEIRDLDAPLGAEMIGVEADRPLSDADRDAIEAAFVRRQVLRVRGVPMTPRQLVALSGRFGELQPHIALKYRHPEAPEIVLMVNQDADGKFDKVGAERGVGWHSDLAYDWAPAKATFLHAVAIPDRGGNTMFADMHRAYETMPEGLRARVDGKLARFRQGGRLALNQGIMDKANRTGDVVHPVIRVHPDSGRKSVYANPYHCVSILGMARAESDALLDELYDWCGRKEFQWEQEWQVGDTIMWENRSAWHSGKLDYPLDQLRKFYRSTVRGTPTVDRALAERLLAAEDMATA